VPVLVSAEARAAAGGDFAWKAMPPTEVAGKSEPLQTYTLDEAAPVSSAA